MRQPPDKPDFEISKKTGIFSPRTMKEPGDNVAIQGELEWIRKVVFVGAGSKVGLIGWIGVAGKDLSDISDMSAGRCVPWPVNYCPPAGLIHHVFIINSTALK